jgi:hypothetical protein
MKDDQNEVVMHFDLPEKEAPSFRISGVSSELLRDPERVRRIMEILELPEGTRARVKYLGSDVIVR